MLASVQLLVEKVVSVSVDLHVRMIAVVKTHKNVVQQRVEERVVWKRYKLSHLHQVDMSYDNLIVFEYSIINPLIFHYACSLDKTKNVHVGECPAVSGEGVFDICGFTCEDDGTCISGFFSL